MPVLVIALPLLRFIITNVDAAGDLLESDFWMLKPKSFRGVVVMGFGFEG